MPFVVMEKGKTIAKITSLAGIGLTFEKVENGSGKPCVKEILPRGSAQRDGIVEIGDLLSHIDSESVTNMKMEHIRERILGVAGTKVRLTIHKINGRVLDVVLTRGSPEWWQFYDDNEVLRRDLVARDKEIDTLKKKLRDAEHVMARDKQEIDQLHGQVASIERLNQKMQIDLDREVDLRRRSENMVNALTAEKKHLDDQIENLLKKVSEVTLSFKSAQGLAREMTEKARQSEQGRANEEKLRKLAEARETKSQTLLLEEIQRRKDTETEMSTQQARMQALEAKLQSQDGLMSQINQLTRSVLDLQSQLSVSQNEAASSKSLIEELRAANGDLHASNGKLEAAVMVSKKAQQEAVDALALAQEVTASANASKEQAIKREGEATKISVASDANAQSAMNKQTSVEASYGRLKEELAAAVKTAADAQAATQKDKLARKELSSEVSALTQRLSELQAAKDQERELLTGQLTVAEGRINDQKQKVAGLENNCKKLSSELLTTSAELNDKIAQSALEKKVLEGRLTQLEADLKRALSDERDVRSQALAYEQKVLAAHQEKETTLSELRVAKGQIESLTDAKNKLEAQSKAQYLEGEALKVALLKGKQENSAMEQTIQDLTTKCTELNRQISDVQTQLRTKTNEAEMLGLRVADLESQLESVPALKKENLTRKGKIRDLEDVVAALKAENARITEAELKCRGEIAVLHKKIEELNGELTTQKVQHLQALGEAERQAAEKLQEACNERDDARVELDRYYSLPNIVGVGMGLEQTTESLPTGGTVRTTKVSGLAPGQAADLSGAIKIGDDLLEVDGIPCIGLTLDEIKAKVAGKRGTKVLLRMMRDETDDGIQNGDIFSLCLKRGSWGPEHCVLEPEDKDMIDQGRWPEPGSVSSQHYDPKAINRK